MLLELWPGVSPFLVHLQVARHVTTTDPYKNSAIVSTRLSQEWLHHRDYSSSNSTQEYSCAFPQALVLVHNNKSIRDRNLTSHRHLPKVMRIGKPLEHAQAAVKSLEIGDPVLRFTALGRQLGYAGYLSHDMLGWVRLVLHSCWLRWPAHDISSF